MIEFWRVVSTSLGTACRTILANLRGVGDEPADLEACEPMDSAEACFPIGFVMRPSGGKPEALCFRLDDQVIAISIIDKSLSVWTDVQEGETRLYGAKEPTARFRILPSGSVTIDAKSGTDVVVNGGSLKVARDTDPVRVGTIAGTAGPWPVLFTFVPVDADGTPLTPVTGATPLLSAVISNAGGAAHFLG